MMGPMQIMSETARETWITGIGLVSSIGEGHSHHALLSERAGAPLLEEQKYAPYTVHPLGSVDFNRQIPKKSDQRQMETWQRIGVYAAGLALEDAGIAHRPELLKQTNLVVAAGSGERDTGVDAKVLQNISSSSDTDVLAKEILPTALRPTLFLAQLSNLLAGNISIVHNVTASSRTFMGEEMAGLSAIENAHRRIAAGQGDVFLVGGALNAEREDLLLGYELGRNLWSQAFLPVWERHENGGGFVPGSVGAFLVLEARQHAEARGQKPYARLTNVATDRSRRELGEASRVLETLLDRLDVSPGPLAVMSGACGVEPVTSDERAFLSGLDSRGLLAAARAYGSRLGHSVEAHFPAGVALAALALREQRFFPPFDGSGVEREFTGSLERVLVTGLGHWRGEGLALLERAG
jgi:3-oxoacyl-[acyl-carrier-protein] synthase II